MEKIDNNEQNKGKLTIHEDKWIQLLQSLHPNSFNIELNHPQNIVSR